MRNRPSQIHLARDLSTGKLISADRAIRQPGRGRYLCLDEQCRRDLTVARSKHGRLHFRHFRDREAKQCHCYGPGRSGNLHSAAQVLLKAILEEAINRRAPMPILMFKTPAGVLSVLPFILGRQAVTEWICPFRRRRADLAILDASGQPVLLVEVFHTHAVDRNKRVDLSPYWWIQVSANEVLENPFRLNVLDHGNLPYEFEILGHQGELFEQALLPTLGIPHLARSSQQRAEINSGI